MKVYLTPEASPSEENNGVGRVVLAQWKYLKEFDIELVKDVKQAEITAAHISDYGKISHLDVLHSHGLYFDADKTGFYSKYSREVNANIVPAARKARTITVPSHWVGEPFRRDMRLNPVVIGHGIDLEDWTPSKSKGYVLWNKNRPSDVCTPIPAWEIAKRGIPVVSTFTPLGKQPGDMQIIGNLPFKEMQRVIAEAEVYLATTPETFGIGTLEALACGIPVLGYNWGGTADIVQHQVNGYLVKPRDIDGLMEGYQWILEHYSELKDAARARAEQYQWKDVIGKYADLYRRIAKDSEPTGVSVVIPCYNKEKWVAKAIESALNQTIPVDVIVVDDGSTDKSLEIINKYRGRVQVIDQINQGVASARNNGIRATNKPFIVCLDADDQIAPNYCEILHEAMLGDDGLGIAYTGLGYILKDQIGPNVWTAQFDWERQATVACPPVTTIHCAAMFRRKMWERAGGFVQKYAPGEDAEFWTRGLSVGYSAKRITDEPLFWYNNVQGSASKTKPYIQIDDNKPWMRDKQFPFAAPTKEMPLVHSYSEPIVSVIIPVGAGHGKIVTEAIETIIGQTMREWECVVVDDSGAHECQWLKTTYPFLRIYETEGKKGAGFARNVGIKEAKAPLVLFLDADDLASSDALYKMCDLFSKSEGRYVYSDWSIITPTGEAKTFPAPEYEPLKWFFKGQHAVTVLMATEDARKLLFDEEMRGWEDWDFFCKAAVMGVHGVRYPEPLLTYRQGTGTRREESLKNKDELLALMKTRYVPYLQGEKQMSNCCGGNADALLAAKRMEGSGTVVSAPVATGLVRMQFTGPQQGEVSYWVNGKEYVGANNTMHKFIDARPGDVSRLEALRKWKRV